MEHLVHAALALLAGMLGVLGGLGGAILLVPALVVTGTTTADAVPLGLVSVAAVSISAAPRQLRERVVNHRVGVTAELVASSGAVAGALVSGMVGERVLTWVLAVAAGGAAVAVLRPPLGLNRPDPDCRTSDVGERVGSLSGAFPLGRDIVPYRPRRLGLTLGAMGVTGVVAGMSGTSGGYLKTPALQALLGLPLRVAAATTTFTVGITAAAALVVFAVQSRLDAELASAVIVGSLVGGLVGARLQSRLPPVPMRRLLALLLLVVTVILVVRA